MSDDIVTRLRDNFAIKDYPMLKDHCHCCAIPKDWGGHHDNCLYDQAAYEIERLRELARALYNETKRCGSKHDVKATNDWEEYDQAVRGE